ncbi:magnesium transporter [Leucobacter aridicollis]|uniref:Magnesium transporter MgtE n=1 Tax=Leucobacter aridicollis TaxID=283878 RepID=A0A852QWP7_9MICO|nr:magnesium transporter [Leucobacter aridicollis]NYD26783.1 magnesium transporter [Leucobacter aridicollis]
MHQTTDQRELENRIVRLLADGNLKQLGHELEGVAPDDAVLILERLGAKQRAVVFRLLHKDEALDVFEALDPSVQSDLMRGLRDAEVAEIFEGLDPDDRVWLLDELPATLAPKLLHGLSERERRLTSVVLGYPQDSVGRRMTPEYVTTRMDYTVDETLARLRDRIDDAETIYLLPVLDDARHIAGVVSLRDLIAAGPDEIVASIMSEAQSIEATEDAERAARRLTEAGFVALPVVDRERRLVGLLTFDDAMRIIEHEESEDSARQGGVEPLRRPYFTTPIMQLVRSRVVWLLVLAVGATLTVQVLDVFEDTLAEVTVLALFVPLLIGTGGNTGNQAATTVTRALALGDVRARDLAKVLGREARVGLMLGLLLGSLGFVLAGLVYSWQIGAVIGLTLVAICTVAATIGGIMPLVARWVKVDPAVFSNPFISTFVDASGLIIYFLIARAILGL